MKSIQQCQQTHVRKIYMTTVAVAVVVDFLYCLYAQSLHHGGIKGRN